jgi:ribosomal protein S18 acetylase RimI-like enzyme
MYSIREAVPSDARPLSKVAETTFRATFAGMNTPENMDAHCRDSFGESLQAAEIMDPGMATLLCERDGELVGFAQLRWGKHPACVVGEKPGELQRLYVVERWQGKGAAQMLMDACLEQMPRRGSDVVWLGVWEHNPRAIAFYTKYDFIEVGDHTFALGADPQRDIVMSRPVAGS